MDLERLDIVILTRDRLADTKRTLDTGTTIWKTHIIAVDDGSTDGTLDFFNQIGASIIKAQRPFIFARNVNQGLRLSTSKYVLVINNDIIFWESAIDKMIEVLDTHPDVGMVGPMSNRAANHPEQRGQTYRTLPMFCLLIRASLFGTVGFLDESFTGYGCEDDDYSIRVMEAGYKLWVCSDAYVQHKHCSTFLSLYDEAQKHDMYYKNKDIFRAKYDGLPPAQDWKEKGLV